VAVDVRTKRVSDQPEPDDGYRVLIDRLWPRGVSRERAHLDEWAPGAGAQRSVAKVLWP
jgi:uncharacterized protein YeaO (DUF488 family)